MEFRDSSNQIKRSAMTSRLPGFYELPITERSQIAAEFANLTDKEYRSLHNFGSLTRELTDVFIENAIGTFSLPLGIATNFVINGEEFLIPMAVEESSVLAAASHGAKLASLGGGFFTTSTPPIMTGQIQLFLNDPTNIAERLAENRQALLVYANRGQDRLTERGGGAKDITWRYIPEIQSLIINLHVDTRDAMGANIVNTMCEKLSVFMREIFPGSDIGLRILTNLTDRRLAKAKCEVPPSAFHSSKFSGEEVAERVERAWLFALHDIHRATTNNKGIMNGIDPVVIATGNDWRAVEAGAHAYACQSGVYRPMASWRRNSNGHLVGELELPMAVGTVGGVTKLHPTAQAAMKLLKNPSATKLAEIICAVGLAQNLSALRALATEGIQQGHMDLHQKNLDLLRRGGTVS